MNPRGLSEDLAWALRLVRQGSERRQVIAAISRKHPKHGYHSLVYGERVKQRGFEAARRYAEGTADKAIRIAKEDSRVMDPHEARVRLAEIREAADAEPWPLELAGARRALEAAFVIASERGRVAALGLDLRTHAMRAGQSFKAIRRHREQLHELGWLLRNPRDRVGRTSRFNLQRPRGTFNRPSRVIRCAPTSGQALGHDAYRPAGLGDRGWYLQYMIDALSHLPDGSDRTLALLQEHGLGVAVPESGLIRLLDLAALRLGTFNTGYREGMHVVVERHARSQESLNVPLKTLMPTESSSSSSAGGSARRRRTDPR